MNILLILDNNKSIINFMISSISKMGGVSILFIPDLSTDDPGKNLGILENLLQKNNFDSAVVEYDFHKVITGCFFDKILKQYNIPWIGLFEESVILFERPRDMGEKGRIVMDGDFLKNKEKLIQCMKELME